MQQPTRGLGSGLIQQTTSEIFSERGIHKNKQIMAQKQCREAGDVELRGTEPSMWVPSPTLHRLVTGPHDVGPTPE